MKRYIKLSNKHYPVTEHEVRQAVYPTVLADEITDSVAESLGYARVIDVPAPSNLPLGYYTEELPPVLDNGNYYQAWEIKSYDLGTKKAIKLQYFNRMFDALISQVKQPYPPTEVESWAKQEKEAREFLLDDNSEALLIRAIAAARGIPVQDLAERIVAKADVYAQYVGNLIGIRQMLEDQIEAATEETIDSITWPPEEDNE